jgi:integrase
VPPERTVWTVEQRDAVLDAVHEHAPHLAAAFELVLLHGLRRNEVLGLRWQDISVDRVNIRQQLGGGPPSLGFSRGC